MRPDRAEEPLRWQDSLLLLGHSVRLLAESGHKCGLFMQAMDRFLDEETIAACRGAEKIGSEKTLGDFADVLSSAARLDPEEKAGLVYGGGAENHPELIAALTQKRPLFGNHPDVLRQLMEAESFFELLRRLGIPYPEIRKERPRDAENWLIKASCSEGGKGVRSADCRGLRPGEYFQRRVRGPAYSVLFLSNGIDSRIIGFNTLWPISIGHHPFLFAGAANFSRLSGATRIEVSSWLSGLVKATGLIGLNGLDFMVTAEGQPLAIEVNPRPCASMALYDEDVPGGLLYRHLLAVRGHLPEIPPTVTCRAFRVMLAPVDLRVEKSRWPDWCQDRPREGSQIRHLEPFCTISASGASPSQAMRSLRTRMRALRSVLSPPNSKRSSPES